MAENKSSVSKADSYREIGEYWDAHDASEIWDETEEVREIFLNNPKFRFIEKGHRKDENVYAAFGQTDAGRYLSCYFVYKNDRRALVLSARDMTDAERRRYGRK